MVWGGVKRLLDHYIKRSNIRVDYVGDPALWSANAFGYTNLDIKHNTRIGVNLIRPNIFESYKEENFSASQMTHLYKEIIEELDARGYDWYFYDNGMDDDHNYGLSLIKVFDLPKEKLLPQLNNAKEYLEMISRFRAVFGARLHACITAVSLGIPVCGMLWDNKLKFFSETMGISQFFSTADELKGRLVVDKIEQSMMFDVNAENLNSYKNKTLVSFESFINSQLEP